MKRFVMSLFLATTVSGTVQAQSGNVGVNTPNPGSTLTVNGSFAGAYTETTANAYTVAETDFSVVWNGSANGTISLPASNTAPNRTGRLYFFKNNSTAYTLTIDPNDSELIDNSAIVTVQPGESILLTKTSNATASGTTYIVTQLSQTQEKYFYAIVGSGTQTLVQNTNPTYNYTSVEYSPNGGTDFNITTNVWTCPQSGWYRLEAMDTATSTTTSNTHNAINIRRNGAAVASSIFFVPGSLQNGGSLSSVLNLQKGDQITVTATPCFGCSANVSSVRRRLEINRQ